MYELTYNPNLQTNDYELSIKTDIGYVFMFSDSIGTLSSDFIELLNTLKSFRVCLTTGTATFRFERSSHWYAYKKIKGKLNKAYVGKVGQFTESLLLDVVARVNTEKVTDIEETVTDIVAFKLAGHGKSDRHLQPSLTDIETLQEELKKAQKLLKERDLESRKMGEKLLQRDELVDYLTRGLDEVTKEFKQLSDENERQASLILSLRGDIDRQESLINALRQEVCNHREEAANYYKQLEQLQWESSRREEQVQGYYFIYESISNEMFNIRTIIEEFRLLAKGKDKRNHPRFAYLLDFLARIDNLS